MAHTGQFCLCATKLEGIQCESLILNLYVTVHSSSSRPSLPTHNPQALVLVFGSLNRALPLIAVTHLLVSLAWVQSTATLGDLLKASEKSQRPLQGKTGDEKPPVAISATEGASPTPGSALPLASNIVPAVIVPVATSSIGTTPSETNGNGHAANIDIDLIEDAAISNP